ncbi:MAG: hypothetical protein ACQEQD_09330 [Bacillota bacterium]
MFKVFPVISLILVGILYIIESSHFIAGLVAFIIQLILLLSTHWLINKVKEKDIKSLIPIISQFKTFFGFSITIWILIAVLGLAAHVVGRVYSILAIIVFVALSFSLTNHIFVTSDLLASYFDENNERKDGKYDKRDK